jgi:HSP20 family molecular chaperone IbpA
MPATALRRSRRGTRRLSAPAMPNARRECVAVCDLTDCLLQAYEFVARRAYEKFLLRGGEPGRELEDWLSAERELLFPISVDIEESEDFVRALAAAPGFSAAEIGVGIEPRWLAIIAYRDSPGEPHPAQVFSIHQLPAEVDPARVTMIFSEGLLGIRMPKASKPR